MDRDLQDIIGIAPEATRPKKDKRKAPGPRKPDGLNRELYGLVGSAPVEVALYPADPLRGLKEKRKVAPTAATHWELCETPCSARSSTDSLRLWRWLPPDEHERLQAGAYNDRLQQLNKPIRVFKYTPAEYDAHLTDPTGRWTKESTDHLFELCERFDLRWVVIHDRFTPEDFPMEELKARYYGCSAALLRARCTTEEDKRLVEGHPVLAEPYDKDREVSRKRHLEALWGRTRQEEAAEALLRRQLRFLANVKRQRAEREQRDRADSSRSLLLQKVQERTAKRPLSPLPPDKAPQESIAVRSIKRLKPGVYLRSRLIHHPLPPGSSDAQSRIDDHIQALGIQPPNQRTFELACELREMYERYLELQTLVRTTETKVFHARRRHLQNPTARSPAPLSTPSEAPPAKALRPGRGRGGPARKPYSARRRCRRPGIDLEDDDDYEDTRSRSRDEDYE